MPSRRALLQSVAATSGMLAVAGCLADENPGQNPSIDDGSAATAEKAEAIETAKTTGMADCTEPRRPEVPVATEGDGVEPRNYPEKPDELTVGTVETYVREFERAYKVNEAIREYELVRYDFLSWSVSDVQEVEDGIVATVGGQVAPFWYQGASTETTPYHADEEYTATYLVSERAVCRTASPRSESPDPRDGEILVCTP